MTFNKQLLKPCPFCGSKVRLRQIQIAMIQCMKCNAIVSFGGKELPFQTVEAWNKRSSDKKKDGQI